MGSLFSSSSRSSVEALGGTPVVLNVYDLTPLNNYMYWFGLGIFHSGIEIHGLEYGFGAHDFPVTGVFEVEPKNCPGFVYRRSITLGCISLSPSETHTFMEQLASDYHGDTYHLISKNCNHFTNDVSSKLIGKPIPGWVNRLARLGAMCNCLLPESLQLPAVKQIHDYHAFSEDGSESFSIITADETDQDRCLLSSSSGAEVTFVKESLK
ncbi:deSI-like protein At4g17486 isoform X1 [Dioscorea cayenensis subsp. rotundata]|uniref:DeSI-like protein At4g17486 isoform X1 n=1 Tax=Dioscorea cayennensis subsp. rotundata TaxID=55577 RepID=A0AB40CRK0_DIOCR|nr:deSI-like protein At4g17486 isoform X1 [Dioscorea cayenensis subsp. rotundata]